MATCKRCKGKGYHGCEKCSGNGYYVPGGFFGLSTKKFPCPKCSGSGEKKCGVSDGSGKT